ncbi:hypothetical protein FS837_010399 [Tulasnella sp. UAMH 9824]|nr:hypothetical protein FS837_010399 [Tulasnella sp. UAMH 9824]
MTQAPVAKFDALPSELSLLIARLSIVGSGHKVQDLIRVSSINAQMRSITLNTSDLWTEFTLSDSSSSHKLGGLCVCRSGNRALDVQMSLPRPMDQDEEVPGFVKCFNSAASKIARLSVYICDPLSLNIINTLLDMEELSMLRDIDLDYGHAPYDGFARSISLPSGGAGLHSVSLIGVQPLPWFQFSLGNLTYLHLGSGEHWRWIHVAMAPLLQAATSLQRLHFVGHGGVFHTLMDEGFGGFQLTLPALRHIRFINTAPGFIFSFLCAVTAPLLEKVDMTAPPHRTHNEDGREIFGWLAAISYIVRHPAAVLPPHTLRLRDEGVKYSQRDTLMLVIFLVGIFPSITSLELDGKLLSVLHMLERLDIYQGPGLPQQQWMIERLKIHSHVDQEVESELGDLVKELTRSLSSLKKKGLKELKLSVGRSIQPPLGRVSVEALEKQVGELILDE